MPALKKHSHAPPFLFTSKLPPLFLFLVPFCFCLFVYFIILAFRLIISNIYCPPANTGSPRKIAWCHLWEYLHTNVKPFPALGSLCLPPCISCRLTGNEFLQPVRLSLYRLSLSSFFSLTGLYGGVWVLVSWQHLVLSSLLSHVK